MCSVWCVVCVCASVCLCVGGREDVQLVVLRALHIDRCTIGDTMQSRLCSAVKNRLHTAWPHRLTLALYMLPSFRVIVAGACAFAYAASFMVATLVIAQKPGTRACPHPHHKPPAPAVCTCPMRVGWCPLNRRETRHTVRCARLLSHAAWACPNACSACG